MLNKFKSISKIQLIALLLILVGAVMVVNYGRRTFTSYRAIEYARTNHFDQGNIDPSLVRPWMNMEYIAVAYTVPQEYLYVELNIPMEQRNSRTPLSKINDQFRDKKANAENDPIVMDEIKAAILAYRADPVSTGLKEGGVRPWMSVQYIANSIGMPAEAIFEQLGIALDGHAYMDLGRLAHEVNYNGGPKALVDELQKVVDSHQGTP
jgi:hypothetical protein